MDPVKVKGIAAWPVPQNASDVQKFRGFANFYRRFIKDFSAVCKPLDRLTGNAPWKWEAEEQEAFDELKRRFTESPVLSMYDPDCKTRIEVDASGYATGAVLSQEGEDGKWHPVAFHSESMSDAERNYEIYDKEMLAIIRALQAWRHYLEGLPSVFEIQSDHKNLEYWKTAQNLTCRQARWALYLSRFEFVILHKPGTSNGWADALSRRPDHQTDDADDNLDRVLLQPDCFRVLAAKRGHMSVVPEKALLRRIRECGEREQEVADALSKLDKLGPARLQNDLVDWNTEQGLLLYRGRSLCPKDDALRAEIVRIHHDLPPAGHPGQAKTVELTCFLLVLDDSYKLRDPEKLSKDDVTGIVTTFASMLDPHVREVIQDIDIDAILSAAPTSATSPPSPTSAKPNLASTKSKSRKHITDAGAVPPDVDATTTQSVTCSAAADNAELTLPAVGVHVQAAATAPVDGAPASAPGLAHGETIPRASRAVTIKEVPDVEALHCAPVLDVKGLLLYRGRVYVPKDDALRAEIVRIHHDLPPAGHPGQAKTVELVTQNYWWPGMVKFIKDYVETCDTCRRGKTSHAKPHGPLQPNEVPDGPGQVVTCDFITGLPDVDGYNALQLIADRHGKIIHLIPCTEEIDVEGTADNFVREWFRLHGLPRKIISDRGPQFSSKLFRAVLKDGQSERWNQEIEAYLRMYCSRHRDDWVKWLPIAEFAFNSHVHSATGYSPFYLMYGFEPQFYIPMLSTAVPSADERREELRQAREDATSALTLAAERMKEYYDRYVRDAPEFKDGQKVWLDTRNFQVPGVSRKLVDRYAGPYLVKRKVGNLAYELKLPKDLALHPVFHVSLLLPHKESKAEHGSSVDRSGSEPTGQSLSEGLIWIRTDQIRQVSRIRGIRIRNL
ncbi:hypothetical protein GSI_12083 [Ganoderma sinense ZZ0214-1]|uniref:Integrase catalytic domain-containing protein n=1 Tax=Ganoderma sinense ZZ0214-1 TaxID=1077348 RepID=A0A2G8RXW5_9APHY|nr:hypothetical protein GSI_12083 [Ganoderma sinense ZZ0214-1]